MNADIYIKAAEMVLYGVYSQSCTAITDAESVHYGPFGPHRMPYYDLFGPHTSEERKAHPWWDKHSRDTKKLRVLALCFMAAIVEAGDA
jgi:hypothetical protein